MRNFLQNFFLGVALCAFNIPAFAQEAQVPAPHYYGIDHAAIEYEISGAEKGAETLYFDQWGMRQARFKSADTTKWGFLNTITLNLAEQIIFIDPNKNLGQKKVDEKLKQLLADPKATSAGLLSLQSVTMMGGKKIADENVSNWACEVWEVESMKLKLWLWNGIIIRSQAQTPEGQINYLVIKIDDVTVVDEAVFTVPPGIKFLDRDINEILISRR